MRFAIIFTLAAASAASASVISGLVRRQEGIPGMLSHIRIPIHHID
jgi:hypothetical protein